MKLWALGLALVLSLSGINAEAAKRLGGGKSFGKQSSNVTQRDATPAAPAAPAQNMNNTAAKPVHEEVKEQVELSRKVAQAIGFDMNRGRCVLPASMDVQSYGIPHLTPY